MTTYAPQSPYPLSGTDEVTAEGIRDLLYDPDTAPLNSLLVVNGDLDASNIAGGAVMREHTQRGTHVWGRSVSGTANLDYRDYWFADYDSPALSFSGLEASIGSAKPIPGACITFSTRGLQLCRFSWNISFTNYSAQTVAQRTHIFLKITSNNAVNLLTGDSIAGQVREVNKTLVVSSLSHEGWRKNRTWSGHYNRAMVVGDHTAGLYIIQDNDIQQARVWARSMNVVRLTW